MSSFLKIVSFVLAINLFMYIGVNLILNEGGCTTANPSWTGGDIFDLVFEDSDTAKCELDKYADSIKTGDNITIVYPFTPSSDFAAPPNKEAGDSNTGSSTSLTGPFSLLDGLKIFYAVIITIFKIAFMPITLFTIEQIPPLIALIIGLPLMVMYVFIVLVIIRGGGAQ